MPYALGESDHIFLNRLPKTAVWLYYSNIHAMTNLGKVMRLKPDPVEERVAAILKTSQRFAVLAMFVYLGGAAISYTVHFADERDACYDAGGFLGRVWCPDSVATDGLPAQFARAAGWPVNIFRAPVGTSGSFEQAAEALKRGDYDTAFRAWQALAQRGNALAQFNLALMYEDGLGVSQDYGEAAKWHRVAAARGLGLAQNSLGLFYKYGLGIGQDYGEAVKLFTSAASLGEEGALSNLGLMYQEGLGVPQNNAEALKWFRLAAEQGEAEAQINISAAYFSGRGVRRNYVEAYKWASIAAGQGAESALVALDTLAAKMSQAQIAKAERRVREWEPPAAGEMSAKLREVLEKTSTSKAQQLLKKLGYMVGNTEGVAGRQTRAAITKFQFRDGMQASGEVSDELIARLENSVQAHQFRLAGGLYLSTQRPTVVAYNCDILAAHYSDKSRPAGVDGVAFSKIDARRAIAACEQAAAYYPDDPRYQFQLARSLQKAKRHKKAARVYRISAEQGFVLAQKNLGFIYANGDGIPQDLAQAAKWLRQAAEKGDADAQFGLGRMYATGRGVPTDESKAVLWYGKAAAQNHLEAQERLFQIENSN